MEGCIRCLKMRFSCSLTHSNRYLLTLWRCWNCSELFALVGSFWAAFFCLIFCNIIISACHNGFVLLNNKIGQILDGFPLLPSVKVGVL